MVLEKYLTHEEVCDYLGISRSQFYKLWKIGDVPPSVTIGKTQRFNPESIKKWLDDKEAGRIFSFEEFEFLKWFYFASDWSSQKNLTDKYSKEVGKPPLEYGVFKE